MDNCRVKGQPVPDDVIREMRDSASLLDDPKALRARLAEDGYLYLKGVVDRDTVMAARAEVFARLVSVGEIREPAIDGIATGDSKRKELEPDLGAFWRSVSEGGKLRAASNGRDMQLIMSLIFGEPARNQDYIFLRAGARGRATGLHFDYPFFTRAHDKVCTVWMPIGDVPVEDGPVVIVEGSNRYRDLIDPMIGFDVSTDKSRKADLGADAISFARSRGTHLLTRNFAAGDIAIFGMYTAHGSLDNHSPIDRVRLSCDLRWQPASLPLDERYFGNPPSGTTGVGYGELNGAKPLTQEWHVR
jgi:ectoine hydroxylase-related dioxygenase (phytanoyl-CoA dioxygenase family)